MNLTSFGAAVDLSGVDASTFTQAISENFVAGLGFIFPVLGIVVGITVIRKIINRGSHGRV